MKNIILSVPVVFSIFFPIPNNASNFYPSGIVSEWNAMHTEGDRVLDSLKINTGSLYNVVSQWDGNGEIFNFNAGHIRIPDSPSLNPMDSFTISTWVKINSHNSSTYQTLVSKVQRNENMHSTDLLSYDATDIEGTSASRGNYSKTVFDGRYIYSVSIPPIGSASKILRYDTRSNFTDPSAWNTFTMLKLKKQPDDRHWYSGYNSLTFDGRYIYLVPTSYSYEPNHGFALRYDTHGALDHTSSWKSFDIKTLDGMSDLVRFRDGAFDGKYVYFTGGGVKKSIGQKIARYDTSLNFDDPNSWTYQAINLILPNVGNTVYNSTVLAGNYLYFIPSDGMFVRYDITKPFNKPTSWTYYNAANTNGSNSSINYIGGAFDGRYIYFSPGSGAYAESMLRYDTQQEFNNPSAWLTYSVKEPISSGKFRLKSYSGMGFDGRYVYYFPYRYKEYNIPRVEERFGGRILRYDTTKPYLESSSWSQLEFNNTQGNLLSVTFDNRYFYIPVGNGSAYRAIITRFDTSSNDNYAFSFNRNFSSDNNSGRTLGPNFNIGTSNGYYSLYSNAVLNNGWHLFTGTYDGSKMSLYIDTNLATSRSASGVLNMNNDDLLLGSSIHNAFNYFGDMNKIQLYNRSLTLLEIKQLYRLSPYGGCDLSVTDSCKRSDNRNN
ncbi:LamG-like jellyroll fold domain-containing protein [Legionella pneumophila]|uniref:LamG domain-containing protein n=1 Tax=Legionella pneumophila subsp. pascullei TaxID=91890 RepID=A0AAX2IWH8_LEGPN|nr:LamG-like jellyroll fold domain-containing protein [Legionella pneumophila]AMP89962.1 hypothetical protein AXF35_09800 [Legionella pneumophila subsp. pascullei]AMP92371.1 hypothetical protein AXF36_07000 [Legionella pneumophila subsp. pascullei]AMP95337.1 hypothetical protein AXF37_06890 [Legionella pneumophila subsp. pascullei]SQG90233.1 Uncharacterised protein [Legionella pneumophila subsp. pascullei]VEH06302.1 Uncharacterised protein [Legionella pneumophila subsp. pascullei]